MTVNIEDVDRFWSQRPINQHWFEEVAAQFAPPNGLPEIGAALVHSEATASDAQLDYLEGRNARGQGGAETVPQFDALSVA